MNEESDAEMLANSWIISCLTPETVQELEAIESEGDNELLWNVLLAQCQSQQKHKIHEINQQLINIGMKASKSLVPYQGRAQQLLKRLIVTDYKVPDAHKWGSMTKGLLEVYKPSVRLINLSFEDLTYQKLTTNLQ